MMGFKRFCNRLRWWLSKPFVVIKNFFFLKRYPFWAFVYPDSKGKRRTAYDSTWYDDIPEGWKKAFGKEISERIRKALIEEYGKRFPKRAVEICEVKEKYGELRIYASAPDSVLDILDEYEGRSFHHCFYCGEKSTKYTLGWILPVCEKHAKGKKCKDIEENIDA